MEWDLLLEGAKTGGKLLDDEKRSELIKKLKLLFRKKRQIILFGNSGAGKSQFVYSLKQSILIPDRNLSTNRVKLDFDEFPVKFIDTPGHSESKSFRRKEVEEIIKNGVEGIINIVSYGYEETPNADKSIAFDENGVLKEDFLEANRANEIKRLNEWLPWVTPENVNWIITLITKSDIWWANRKEVHDYYNSPTYTKEFEALGKFVPMVTLPYCSIIKPYFRVRTSGVFGEEEKVKLYANLNRTLLNLLGKEEKK